MHFLQHVVLACVYILAALVAIGLYRPWVVLWWADYSHRKRVLLTYGVLLFGSLVVYYLLKMFG